MQKRYYHSLALNTLLLRELGQVQTALTGAGLRCLVLKGAALEATIYPEPGLRPMVDVDLLIDETGLLVPPADPDALAAAILRLLADPGLRQSMGSRARQRARQLFSVEQYVANTLAVYRDVVAVPA